MIFELVFSIIVCNLAIFYFHSIFSISNKLIKISISNTFKIIFGYSIFIIFIYYLYFILGLKTETIRLFIFLTILISLVNLKNYLNDFFLKEENLLLNFLLIVFLIPAILYGEQFFIFRGNYWDSSNYLSSAILFREYGYEEIKQGLFDNFFLEFQNFQYITSARPLVNYLISLIIIDNISIFFVYYFFKVLITILIFLSLLSFLKKYFNFNNKYVLTLVACSYIFSFWNIYVFEIDALSHYASIPILILIVSLFFDIFNNLTLKKNYFIVSILSSSLFIIYPEIFIILLLLFLVLFFDNIRKINKKIIFNFFWCFLIFGILTIASYKTNYEFLINSQFNQMVRSNDWWGYFGSFILGRENLVLEPQFVDKLKILYHGNNTDENIFSLIHNEHFQNGYKFIYLNILPSISGMYFLMPGKIFDNYFFILQYIFIIIVLLYLLRISYFNLNHLLKDNYCKNKMIIFIVLILITLSFFIFKKSYWPIIKLYTYLSPFIFLFFAVDLKKHKLNKFYIFSVSLFFLYKFSIFNYGIGRLDSFPSIINPDLKKEIEWNDSQLKNLENCKELSFNGDNYIIKAYLNLKLLDHNRSDRNTKKICEVSLEKNFFDIKYDK